MLLLAAPFSAARSAVPRDVDPVAGMTPTRAHVYMLINRGLRTRQLLLLRELKELCRPFEHLRSDIMPIREQLPTEYPSAVRSRSAPTKGASARKTWRKQQREENKNRLREHARSIMDKLGDPS